METTKSPSKNESIFKSCGIYTHFFLNQISPFVTTWIDLESTTLSQISQWKTNTIWSFLQVESQKIKQNKKPRKFIDTENRLVVVIGRGQKKWVKENQNFMKREKDIIMYKKKKSWAHAMCLDFSVREQDDVTSKGRILTLELDRDMF